AFCVLLTLQGCVVALGYAISEVVDAEEQRLAGISSWEAEMAAMDCEQLTAEHGKLVENKDAYAVDFDQREDAVRDKLNEKSCALPAALQG
ncbi:MAG: hypothetical protein AAF293_20285, partial [Pseudomonadota bacterium]